MLSLPSLCHLPFLSVCGLRGQFHWGDQPLILKWGAEDPPPSVPVLQFLLHPQALSDIIYLVCSTVTRPGLQVSFLVSSFDSTVGPVLHRASF